MNKKAPVIITIVTILFLLLGFLLYKVSPQPISALNLDDFDLSQVQKTESPRPIEDSDHVLGNTDAKNTLIVYEDLQCPACRSFEPILKELPSQLQDTRVVFRHYPLVTIHRNAVAGSYAAEAAGAQGKFWEFISLMYERQSEWDALANPIDKIVEIALASGVGDVEKFKSDILNKSNKEKIQKDYFEALGMNLSGTPSLIFNGKPIQLGGLDSIKQQVEPLYVK